MFTVALIGGDGAGKTTIASRLVESYPSPVKYLYMGMNIQSSNFALPTSRLAFYFKKRRVNAASHPAAGGEQATKSKVQTEAEFDLGHIRIERGRLGAAARLFNRLAEEWYRQFVSWWYQLRGYIVLYDRHFAFDYDNATSASELRNQPLSEQIHRWCLDHLYPRADLVIFLDAPPDVLRSRKKDASVEHLQRRRAAFLRRGATTSNFFRVDAARSIEHVLAEVSSLIDRFHDCHVRRHPRSQQNEDRVTRGDHGWENS